MPLCPNCGAATAPGPACGSCGSPLPPALAFSLTPLRTVAGSLLGVGIFIAAAGLILLGTSAVFAPFFAGPSLFAAAVLAVGTVGIVAGACLLARQGWAWGLSVGLVAFGLVYAVAGLARGYTSGFVGLAVWGALAYGLSREDVRAPLRE